MIDSRTAPYGAFVLRASLGIVFLAHAGLKIFVFTPAGTVGFFQSIGLLGLFAYATIGAELVAGIALLAGLYTRFVSVAMIPILAGTIIFVHGANGWQFGAEGGGREYPAFLIAACVTQALLGDGAFSSSQKLPNGIRFSSLKSAWG
ncbi:MAG: DoxX family protein [Pseudomonadota bacterium]